MKTPAANLGSVRWCIKSRLATSGRILCMADAARVTPSGALMLVRIAAQQADGGSLTVAEDVNLVIGVGDWEACMPVAENVVGPAIEEWQGWSKK